ncbi:DivIVA domain-containing protein [Catenuloplanes nepalensis]|uniref:DivIVA domain-containing protein n=1 Tax=Catenuloplanes nepalensis TaxID=587533 RepID=A0ABT9MWL0_9ACTN|nr:DivIVA domain-containing protein [Catenuloplanes nepalensis]MDP9795839.1 DivIVA domain-containing protein [Catenuloplanes nepalensis]
MLHWTQIAHGVALVVGAVVLVTAYAVAGVPRWVAYLITAAYVALVAWVIQRFRDRDVRTAMAEPVDSRQRALAPSAQFVVVLRGYDTGHVHAMVERVDMARGSDSPVFRTAVAAEARGAAFPIVMRGYDRGEVDAWLATAAGELST